MKKKIVWTFALLLIGMNVVAFLHAYKFTHFAAGELARTKDPAQLGTLEKALLLFTGIDNPRPATRVTPKRAYKTYNIQSNFLLEAWRLDVPQARGTVILFHGYAGEKSSLLTRADEFLKMGYSTLLVDFTGSGGSEGNHTTVGFDEAREVYDCYASVRATGERNIILFGTSMGAAAILKASQDFEMNPAAVILECPFGSLYRTVQARFDMMNIPAVPMAALLTFWGGAQHGYWAFGHNPQQYARRVTCPALLLYGKQDERVSLEETESIYNNLPHQKVLKVYDDAGHDVFADANKKRWAADVSAFIRSIAVQ